MATDRGPEREFGFNGCRRGGSDDGDDPVKAKSGH